MINQIFVVILSGAGFIQLVRSHPLIQSIQPNPTTSYQQNVYRQPYPEAFVIQPSYTNPYPQHVIVQNPLPAYQPVQVPSIQDQVNQIYWDKLLSIPSVRNLLDPNKNIYEHGSTIPTSQQNPSNQGSVVNNYIIVPPEYMKINETASRPKKNKLAQKGVKNASNKNNLTKQNVGKNCKEPAEKSVKPQKVKQEDSKAWNFKTENIKCFTPADILKDEIYQPNKKTIKKKPVTKHKPTKTTTAKVNTNSECKHESGQCKSKKKNKVKKKSTEGDYNNYDDKKMLNIYSETSTGSSKSQRKKELSECECEKKSDSCSKIKATEINSKPCHCNQDLEDMLLSSLFQQGCNDLENRQARNSNNNRNDMYPNIPNDISKSFDWYMNFSPHTLQQHTSDPYSFFGSNMYPFDIAKIYQMPQYSVPNVDKPSANTGRSKNNKRKKKNKKKPTNTMTADEIISPADSNSPVINPGIGDQIKTNVEMTPVRKQTELKDSESTGITTTEITTQISRDYIDRPSELFEVPLRRTEISQALKLNEHNNTDEENIKIKEVFETQIPQSILENNLKTNHNRIPQINTHSYDVVPQEDTFKFPEIRLEDDMYSIDDNRLLEDYYPDFTVDNHAYLLSKEELDLYNINDRYFYTADKNYDSEDNTYYRKTNKNEKNCEDESDESDEIVFRTPPGLDMPDFVTRKVNKDKQDSTEIYYQHNNQYDDFDRFNLDSFADRSDCSYKTAERPGKENKPGSVVETVYARSKVVKYGQSQDLDKTHRSKTNFSYPALEDVNIHKDGEKTIVIAKSLSPEEIW